MSLHERIPVLQPLAVAPNIVDDCSGNTAVAPVVVGMYAPETRCAVVVMQPQLGTHGIDVAVLTNGSGVIRHLAIREDTAVAEGILTVRIDIFCIESERERIRQFDIHAHIRVCQRERAKAHLRAHMHAFIILKIRFAGRQIDIACRTELPRRLENIGFLALVELYLLHIIQREATQVHLSVLCIAQLHTIIIDSGMLTSHRAHIDGLDTPYSTVVFQLHAGKIANCISYCQCIQALQFLSGEVLRNNDIFGQSTRRHFHFIDAEVTVQRVQLSLAYRKSRACT